MPLPTAIKSSVVSPLLQAKVIGPIPPLTAKSAPPSNVLSQDASVIAIDEVILQAAVVKFGPVTHEPLFPHLIFHSYVVDVLSPFKVYNWGPKVFGIVIVGNHKDVDASLCLNR